VAISHIWIGLLLFQSGAWYVSAPVLFAQFVQVLDVVDAAYCDPAGVPPAHTEQLVFAAPML
jgi:hypothetical protein